jgi:hypothetical protein
MGIGSDVTKVSQEFPEAVRVCSGFVSNSQRSAGAEPSD